MGSDLEFEHDLESRYSGSLLNPSANPNFVVGFVDTGSDVDLAAGSFAGTLGLVGARLTPNSIPIGGVGGQVDARITMPVGFFAAGLSAIDAAGRLDFTALVGHSNVCGLAAPPIDCGTGELVTAIIGMPFLAFYNIMIRVDTPREVRVGGRTYVGPDVQLLDRFDLLPEFAHVVSLEFGSALSPLVTTANYYPDFIDLETPSFPTLLSLGPGLVPSGGSFFTGERTVFLLEGEPGPTNPVQPVRFLADTGAQSSIISRAMAGNLNLPRTPDFTVDVCGVGGLVEGVPGYYVDYVKINAFGEGPLEFSRAPFVVLDLPSPEGGVLDGILGMNFFWNRNVIFEPGLGPTGANGFLHVSEPVPMAYGDFDFDRDVDAYDAATLTSCLTGPGSPGLHPACDHADLDDDSIIGLTEFARFQLCFGNDTASDPNCRR